MSAVLCLDPKGTASEVLRAATARGLDVVALLSDPALLDFETRALCKVVLPVESWEDLDAVDRLVDGVAKDHGIEGVYFNLEATCLAGNHLRRRFGLPHVHAATVELSLDKARLRRRMREAGLSTLASLPATELQNVSRWPFAGAAYFKPTHGCASAFVARITSLAELREAEAAFHAGRSTDPLWVRNYLRWRGVAYHVEEEVVGELLSVEALSHGGVFRPIGLLSRIRYSKNDIVEMGSVFPYPHPRAKAITDFVRRVHEELGFLEGPTHTEVIVAADGRIELVDFNPRIVGADVLMSINAALGCRLEEALLEWSLGREASVSTEIKGYSCLQYVLPPREVVFESLTLPVAPDVLYRKQFLQPGEVVRSTDQQTDYLGCYLTFGASFEAALARSAELRDSVRINGTLLGSF